jgi:hypothetical protein
MMPAQVYLRVGGEAPQLVWQVMLKVGVQSFEVGTAWEDDKEAAMFLAQMLVQALRQAGASVEVER